MQNALQILPSPAQSWPFVPCQVPSRCLQPHQPAPGGSRSPFLVETARDDLHPRSQVQESCAVERPHRIARVTGACFLGHLPHLCASLNSFGRPMAHVPRGQTQPPLFGGTCGLLHGLTAPQDRASGWPRGSSAELGAAAHYPWTATGRDIITSSKSVSRRQQEAGTSCPRPCPCQSGSGDMLRLLVVPCFEWVVCHAGVPRDKREDCRTGNGLPLP